MKLEFRRASYYASDLTPEEAAASETWEGWLKLKDDLGYRTSNIERAALLRDHAIGEAADRLTKWCGERTAAVADSIAVDAAINVPARQGLVYRPYQKAGIAFMRARYASLNADVPRLGKTIQTLGVVNTYGHCLKVLVVCPANAKSHWVREARKWLVHQGTVGWCEGDTNPQSDFLVINYDILDRHIDHLRSVAWDVIVYDECHALKNPKSQRTIHCLGGDRKPPLKASKHILFLSGTPIYTRPIDFWGVIKFCDPNGLGKSWFSFVHRYCDAKSNGFALDVSGRSHEAELQFNCRRSFMIRREKKDVVTELKPSRQTILLSKAGLSKLIKNEKNAVQRNLSVLFDLLNVQDPDHHAETLKLFEQIGDHIPGPVATARRELAIAKIKMCVEEIEQILLTEQKVVIFCYHREVGETLAQHFPHAALVLGGLTTKQRDAERERFQTDPNCRVFIGNIQAAGSAIELSAADCVIFVELSFVPAEIDQAEERIWLLTKTVPMTVIRLIVEDSLDVPLSVILEARQCSVNRSMNREHMVGVVN